MGRYALDFCWSEQGVGVIPDIVSSRRRRKLVVLPHHAVDVLTC